MIEPAYFEQADQELEELNRKRDDFMADATPVCFEDTPKLIELGEKLRTEDTSTADTFLRVLGRTIPEYH